LLCRAGRNPNLALLYALNPLVILELTGNLHAEALLIFGVLLAVWLFGRGSGRGRFTRPAAALALAIGAKLLPLLLLPVVVVWLGWQRGLRFAGLTILFTALLFAPFLRVELLVNLWTSLGLYVHTFVFNASLYPLVRAAGRWLTGANTSTATGVALSLLTLAGTVIIARRWGRTNLAGAVLLTLTGYFLLTTTVHPWYLTSLVAIGVFVPLRYPLVWSGLVWLSYSAYSVANPEIYLWLTGLEYGILLVVLVFDRANQTACDVA
jgi:alpha-1,6-mannosyltransferase